MNSRTLLVTCWLIATQLTLLAQYAPAIQIDQPRVVAPHWFDADGDGDQDVAFFGDHLCLSKNSGQGLFELFHMLPSLPAGYSDLGSMDVDLDGDLDLVVIGSLYDSATHWLANNGTGEFAIAGILPNIGFDSGGANNRYFFADINGDTLPDVLASSSYATRYIINGWSEPFGTLINFNNARSAVFGDINLDGQLDLVGHGIGPQAPVQWWQNFDGYFTPVSLWVGEHAGDFMRLEVFDVDHDGDSDVVAFEQSAIRLMLNDTATGFAPTVTLGSFGYYQAASRIADIDGDGSFDLVVQTPDSIRYMRNNGDGSFDPPVLFMGPVASPEEFAIIDLDNNGLLDVATVVQQNEGLTWFAQDSAATFGPQRSVVSSTGGMYHYGTPSWGDLDADGDIDVMLNGQWLEQTSPGVLDLVHTTNYLAKHPAPADLNGDGQMDCFTFWSDGDDSGLFQYMHGGEGDWPATQIIIGYGQRSEILTWDPDGDNDVDLLRPVFGNGVSAFVNDGSGQLSMTDIIGADPSQAYRAAIADFDGDGDDDVAATGVYAGYTSLLVHRNDGAWGFPPIPAAVTAVSWWGGSQAVKHIRAADLDMDGTPDIMADKGGVLIWYANQFGNGTSWVEHALGVAVSLEFFAFDLADVDADGDSDLLYASSDGTTLLWRSNDGQGTFSNDQTLLTASFDRVAGVRAFDMDADMDPDLLVTMTPITGFNHRTLLMVNTMTYSLGLPAATIAKSLSAHPVPADHQVRIEVDPGMRNDGLFCLTDPGGRTLRTWPSGLPDALTIERDGLLPGIYLLTLRSAHYPPASTRIVFR